MKRIFIFLLCLISFAYGQVTPKASTTFQFGWLDVRSFGAIGDSSTDCTTAIRSALAEAARYRTTLYFPSGNYVVSDTFSVMSGVSIVGAGGNGLTNDVLAAAINKSASTNILQRGSNKKTFVVGSNAATPSNTGINFRDINIIYQAGGTPSSGSGIYVTDGGNYTLERVGVMNFYDNIYSSAAAYWTMHSCWITSAAHVNLTITNTYNPDFGDMSISDCFFASGQNYVHPFADIYWKSSGGFKVSNTKFNVTTLDTTHNKMFGIYMDNTDGGSVDMFFNNLSIEGFDSSAIRSRWRQGYMANILLSNIQTYTITDAFAPAINLEYDGSSPGAAAGLIAITNIVGNAYTVTATYPVVKLLRCSNVKVSNIVNYQYLKELDVVNSANVITPLVRTIASADQDYINVNSLEGIDINVASSVTGAVLAPANLRFRNGALALGQFTGNGELIIGGTATTSISSSYPFLQAIKDTAAMANLSIYNPHTSGTTTGASIGIRSNGAQALFETTGSTFTPYKTIPASALGIYSTAPITVLSDGGALRLANLNSHGLYLDASAPFLGIDNAAPAAVLDVGGTIVNQANNGALGNMFSVRNNLLGNTSTGVSGTVTDYAVSGFGANSLSASNTGVTYTNASTIYIAGVPTASTNVTITNPWALKIQAGNEMINNGNLKLGTAGNKIQITEGSNGSVGQVALVSGTKAITITGLTTSGRAFITLVSQGGTTTTTTAYEAVCTSNTLTINAVTAAGTNTVNTTDTSTLNYFIIN